MDLLQRLGLTRAAPEDNYVSFAIYPPDGAGTSEADLDAFAAECLAAVTPYLEGYIWHRDTFSLTSSLRTPAPWERPRPAPRSRRAAAAAAAKQQQNEAAAAAGAQEAAAGGGEQQQQQEQQQRNARPPCLWGAVSFGDGVDDEWFVVWLVTQVTLRVTGASARVWDDDGEFLLIEAAYSLPRWLKPEVGSGRVWLHGGRLHIVPLPSARYPELPSLPTVGEALAIVRADGVDTLTPKIEAPIFKRISTYPAAARANTHRARAVLPRRAALALQSDSRLLASAIETFYCRDASDMRAAARARRFPASDMVSLVIPMSRAMYAQLKQQPYTAPRNSGWPAPPRGDPLFSSVDLGAKLTAGLEMACARGTRAAAAAASTATSDEKNSSSSGGGAGENGVSGSKEVTDRRALVAALEDTPQWRAYLSRLEASGYFGAERAGSARHNQLLAAARSAFADSGAFRGAAARAAAPAERAAAALAAAGEPWDLPSAAAASAGTSSTAPSAASTASAGPSSSTSAVAAGDSSAGQTQHPQGSSPFPPPIQFEQGEEDSDSWMAEAAEELERQISAREAEAAAHEERREARRQGREQQQQQQPGKQQQQQQQEKGQQQEEQGPAGTSGAIEVDAADVAGRVRGFLQHLSSYEGAEVPVPGSRGAGASGSGGDRNSGDENGSSSGGAGVRFDPGDFLSQLAEALGPSFGGVDAAAAAARQSGGASSGAGGASSSRRGRAARGEEEGAEKEAGLRALLQGLRSAVAAAGIDPGTCQDEDEEGWSSSEEEGSSFFGSGGGSDDDSSEEEEGRAAVVAAAIARAEATAMPVNLRQVPSAAAAANGGGGSSSAGPPAALPPRLAALQERWEVATETDSDDASTPRGSGRGEEEGEEEDGLSIGGDDAAFMEAYEEALESELAATRLVESFERAPLTDAAAAAGGGSVEEDSAAAGAAGEGPGSSSAGTGLRPVDLDLNLVKSLVASYAGQGGLPGPAGNLAGLLGIRLPADGGGGSGGSGGAGGGAGGGGGG